VAEETEDESYDCVGDRGNKLWDEAAIVEFFDVPILGRPMWLDLQ
jgi:hypothetical protein